MATKVSNLCDVVHRVVTSSCLLHPLAQAREAGEETHFDEEEEKKRGEGVESETAVEEKEEGFSYSALKGEEEERVREMEDLMEEVFEAVSSVKRAYVRLQEAHCPWDPEKMRVADVAVVAELKRLGTLRERFRRKGRGGGGTKRLDPYRGSVAVVGPYEAALEEVKREVKAKEAEVEGLKEKLRDVMKGGLHQLHRRGRSISQAAAAAAPTPELFVSCMKQVKEASKSFTSLLLSLLRAARCDISPTISSILHSLTPPPPPHHTKHAIESYVTRNFFQGFENETFYLEGSLSSLLHPDKFRRDCFTQFCDMKAMDPAELLGILPNCNFGKFCNRKYLSMVPSNLEESLFGDLEQRRAVMAGDHPRTEFYIEFLKVAKAVWLLHSLSFALHPVPNQLDASCGVDFHPEYMESVVKISEGRAPAGQMKVGFLVSPGFKLGRSVVKARVYLVSRLDQL
ncbi:hypothetical protein MRB53_001237 [Persea americana]|uniref:Uncharacterized protein n=2 Tax=Persea americana TaxID=3435 RepID=A0ACC2MTF7_PERAE|nr:hypothetical protein MRB53_001220 [Persea americana]KAJ8648214.1 hypothetical protein MRB53_001237 [Persea americana]